MARELRDRRTAPTRNRAWRRGRGSPTPWMMRPVLPPLDEYDAIPSFKERAPFDAGVIRALWHEHMSGSPVRMDREASRMRRWMRTDRDGVLTPDEETALHDFLEALRGIDLFAFRQSCGASIYAVSLSTSPSESGTGNNSSRISDCLLRRIPSRRHRLFHVLRAMFRVMPSQPRGSSISLSLSGSDRTSAIAVIVASCTTSSASSPSLTRCIATITNVSRWRSTHSPTITPNVFLLFTAVIPRNEIALGNRPRPAKRAYAPPSPNPLMSYQSIARSATPSGSPGPIPRSTSTASVLPTTSKSIIRSLTITVP